MRTSLLAKAVAPIVIVVASAATVAQPLAPTISSRNAHVLVSKSDGSVVAWGSDVFGKLGSGRPVYQTTPRRVPNVPPMVALDTYEYHVLAIDTSGRVWSWGRNDSGELGTRHQRNASLPGRVLGLSNVVQVAATRERSLALKSDGTVWGWGQDFADGSSHSEPRQLAGLSNIVQISAGLNHFFARRSDGVVLALGQFADGQLGIDLTTLIVGPGQGMLSTPVPVLLPPNVIDVAATVYGGTARTADGKVWMWGKIGNLSRPGIAKPREVTGFGVPVARLLGGNIVAQAILADGTWWQWDTLTAPAPIPGFTGVRHAVAAVDSFASTYAAITVDGRMLIRSANANGERGLGIVGTIDSAEITQVPAPTNFKTVDMHFNGIVAVTENGELWVWGADVNGSLADGAVQASSVPRPIAGVASIKQVAVSFDASFALDTSGNVWAWGDNNSSQLGIGSTTPSSTPIQVPITGVKAIAAGYGHVLYLKEDRSVWMAGWLPPFFSTRPQQVMGLPPIRAIAGGWFVGYAISETGKVWAWGNNDRGQVGNGTTTMVQPTPVEIAVPGEVMQVSADGIMALAVNKAGDVYGWGGIDNGLLGTDVPCCTPAYALVPQKVSGLANVVEVAVGPLHFLARLADGTVKSWGRGVLDALGRSSDSTTPAYFPSPVLELDSVVAVAAGWSGSYAIRSDGSVWGWGTNCSSGACPSVGDGSLAPRPRPVVVIREDGRGNLDTNDWFLDAKPGVAKNIPPSKIPKVIAVTQSLSSSGVLNVDATLNVRQNDYGKTLGIYVTGLVPAAFLDQVTKAPGAQAKRAGLKADQMVLVNLTPSGWTIASGQLEAYRSGVTNGALAATNLLVNVSPATIPGARFCIGYGESASDMLKTETIRDFLALEGASTSAFGLPCLLPGVYMDGPHTSQQGSTVPVRAVVVGQGPTGTVRFKERFKDISANVALAAVNAAVSDASLAYTPPVAGEYAFAASYSGDALNAASSSEVPLRHVVQAVQPGTTTRIDAALASEIGMELRLVAVVTGNRPSGTVQFKRNGANEGGTVPVVEDRAVLSVVGLGIGDYAFTAAYSGDAGNQPSTSGVFVHKVLEVATSVAALASSANPASMGSTVTLTATVAGSSPTGTVALREGATVFAAKALANGSAAFVLNGLSAGVHVFTADYAGDANNPATTSNAVFEQITLVGSPVVLIAVRSGSGIGTVTSAPAGIDCGAICSADFVSGSTATLTATAAAGSVFTGWSGSGCSGMNACTVSLTAPTTVTATFVPVGAALSVAPLALDFGGQAVRTTSTRQTAKLTNLTASPVAIASVSVPAGYTVTHNCTTLVAGASCTVTAIFAPELEGPANGTIATIYTPLGGATSGVNIAVTGAGEKSLVTHYYRAILGRAPDVGGKSFWDAEALRMQVLGVNVNETWFSMAMSFFSSPEYLVLNRNNAGYVTDLYTTFFNRAPDAGGLSYWTNQLDAGLPREVALVSFMFSAEFSAFTQGIFGNTAARKEVDTVVDFYRGLLARLPDDSGFNYWVGRFRQAQCAGTSAVQAEAEAISSAYANSAEYTARGRSGAQYVGDLYNAFLRRGGDLGGVQFWISQVDTGARTRENVRQQFVASAEFSARVNAIIAQGCLQ